MHWNCATAFSANMDDEDMMIHIINNLSRDYDDMIDSFELQMNVTHDTLTLQGLKEQLCSKFSRLGYRRSAPRQDWAMNTAGSTSACQKCGKQGYFHRECKATGYEILSMWTKHKPFYCMYCKKP